MVFSSPIFLFLFLPIVLTVYLLLRGVRLKNVWLLGASLVFYAWGEPLFVVLMFLSTLANYSLGRWLARTPELLARKWIVAVALILNLGVLLFFKYANFLIENVNVALRTAHLAPVHLHQVALPLGISFFTFHALSYVLDVYRGKAQAAQRVSDVALYIFLFPQLIAGPILRWGTMAPQFARRVLSRDRFWEGVRRFIYGLAKKVLLANTLAVAADRVFSLAPELLSPALVWVGLISYTLQIFFDFSGYSDMAVGLGKMLGFDFIENFNYPYIARSIHDFWRRWHISLATWFRDYVYFPMAGFDASPRRAAWSLLVVFLLCGLWHGASWTFVVWGLYYGALLVLERTRAGRWQESLPAAFRHAYTLLLVMLGWVLFRSNSITHAGQLLHAMVTFHGIDHLTQALEVIATFLAAFGLGQNTDQTPLVATIVTQQVAWAMLAGAILCLPVAPWAKREFQRLFPPQLGPVLSVARFTAEPLALMALLLASSASLADGTYNPFIYFRF